jgi:hypothetical protein
MIPRERSWPRSSSSLSSGTKKDSADGLFIHDRRCLSCAFARADSPTTRRSLARVSRTKDGGDRVSKAVCARDRNNNCKKELRTYVSRRPLPHPGTRWHRCICNLPRSSIQSCAAAAAVTNPPRASLIPKQPFAERSLPRNCSSSLEVDKRY